MEFVLFSDADFLKQITIDKLSSKSYEPYYDDLFYGPVKLNKETTFTERKDENLYRSQTEISSYQFDMLGFLSLIFCIIGN